MNYLPAFYFPTTLICVDDKQIVLAAHKRLFGNTFNCKFFRDSKRVQEFFSNYKSPLKEILFLDKITEYESENFAVKSAVELDISKIIDISEDLNRFQEVAVILVDYYMTPGINGLELCESLKQHKIKKMLLTENSNYQEATKALNNEIIDYFANKIEPIEQIKETVKYLAINFFCDITANFRHHLEAEGTIPISDAKFIEYFKKIINDKNIEEYYLVDINGSYLLKDKSFKSYILIVHNDMSLSNFIERLEEYNHIDEEIELIKQRKKLPFFGIKKELIDLNTFALKDYLFDIDLLNGKRPYYLHLMEYKQ